MNKIAVVKEACYQDLWILDKSKGLKNLLCSTLQRTGPIGLLDIFNGDFFILETNRTNLANKLRKKQTPIAAKESNNIENRKSRFSNSSPKEIAKSPDSIDWDKYDIVISINFAVPIKIRKKYKNILWILLTGEGRYPLGLNNWDYLISHNCPTSPFLNRTVIDMPYTLISSNFLIKNFDKGTIKKGIYFELNSFNKISNKNYWRNRKQNPFPSSFSKLNIPLRFHNGYMKSHINKLISSKYYVKYKGREIRGNSLLEAISAECVCLIGYSDCFGQLNLPGFCYYSNLNELIEKIEFLERNDKYRLELISLQQIMLDSVITNVDLQFKQALKRKRNISKNKSINLKEKFYKSLSYLNYWLLNRVKIHGVESYKFLPPMYE